MCAFCQALERVARAYPRAVFYPLLMTKTSAEREAQGTTGSDGGGRLGKLTALSFDSSAEAFAQVGEDDIVKCLLVGRATLVRTISGYVACQNILCCL